MNKELLADKLFSRFQERAQKYIQGIEILEIDPLFKRTETGVFMPGESLFGVTDDELGVITTTLAASPHVSSTIPQETFAKSLSLFQSEKPTTISLHECLPPHLIIWWKDRQIENLDFVQLNGLPVDRLSKHLHRIAKETEKGISFLDSLNNKPSIAGTWGYGDRSVRAQSGLGRGGPTNPLGHLHLVNYRAGHHFSWCNATPSIEQKINHYRPLLILIQELFESQIRTIIQKISTDSVNAKSDIKTVRELNSPTSFLDGYQVHFQDPLPLQQLLYYFSKLSRELDCLYSSLKQMYEDQLIANNSNQLLESIKLIFVDYNFPESFFQELVNLLQSIRPTLGQLQTAQTILQTMDNHKEQERKIVRTIRKYKNFNMRINHSRNTQSFLRKILKDMTDLPSEKNSSLFTFPERMSCGYFIDQNDYTISEMGEVLISTVNIFPIMASTEGMVERITGAIIERPIPEKELYAKS